MTKEWRLVISARYVREKNNYKTEDVWTDKYDLAEGLEFCLPGHTQKSYVRSVTPTVTGIEAVLVQPIDYASFFSSEKPLYLHYSDYHESCGDGIDERWDVAIALERNSD